MYQVIYHLVFYRCMCVKIVASLQRNPKCTTFIWKTTTLSVRHSTNSMTRGISSSQMQTLPACCFRSILKETKKNEINKTKTKQETNPGILLNSAPRGHNIRHNIVWIRLWSFISKIWIFKFKMQWKTIADFFKTLITNFVPLIIEKKNETLKFKKNYSILLNFTEINLH